MNVKYRTEKLDNSPHFEIITFDEDGMLGEDSIPVNPSDAEPILMSFGDEESRLTALHRMTFSWVDPQNSVLPDSLTEEDDRDEILAVAEKLHGRWQDIVCGKDTGAWLVNVEVKLTLGEIALCYACKELSSFAFCISILLDSEGEEDDTNLHMILDFKAPRARSGYVPSYRFIRDGEKSTYVDKGDPNCWRTTTIPHDFAKEADICEYTNF